MVLDDTLLDLQPLSQYTGVSLFWPGSFEERNEDLKCVIAQFWTRLTRLQSAKSLVLAFQLSDSAAKLFVLKERPLVLFLCQRHALFEHA
jgi:hypothetical protein